MKKNITIGEKYEPAMKITDPEEAKKYFEECVKHTMGHGRTREEAIDIEKQNLGYFSGYYNAETMKRVQDLFLCEHPIFGKAFPTAEEAFNMGAEMATRKRG